MLTECTHRKLESSILNNIPFPGSLFRFTCFHTTEVSLPAPPCVPTSDAASGRPPFQPRQPLTPPLERAEICTLAPALTDIL